MKTLFNDAKIYNLQSRHVKTIVTFAQQLFLNIGWQCKNSFLQAVKVQLMLVENIKVREARPIKLIEENAAKK